MGWLDDSRSEGRLVLFAADLLTVLLLTAGTALAFLSGYEIKTDPGAVLAFCVLASAVFTAVHSLTRPWWSLALAGGIALLFWPLWETAEPVLGWLGQKMGLMPVPAGQPLSVLTPEPEELLPVLLLLCAVLAWSMGLTAVRVRQWYLAALLHVIPLLPAIRMGVLPGWGAMLAAFAGWGTLLLTALYGRRDPGSLGRARLLSLGGMCALLLALVMALPSEGYLRPQWATDARNSLIRGVTRQLERYFDMETLEGGTLLGLDLSIPDEVPAVGAGSGEDRAAMAFGGGSSWQREDLMNLSPRRYQYRQVMEVATDDPDGPGQRLYLLGGTLNTYTGVSWEQASGFYPWEPVASFPMSTAPEGAAYTMSIRYTNLFGAWYYPYRFLAGGELDESGRLSGVAVQDLSAAAAESEEDLPDRGKQYVIAYRPGGPEDGYAGIPVGWTEAEQNYRHDGEGLFEEVYLAVPDGLRSALAPLVEELERMPAAGDETLPEQFREPVAAASRTAALLETLAAYDLNTPAMEPGEDFIEHFLSEGRGYCVHFATAGAMLLRMQGIPARYAAGYVTQLGDQGRSRVLDSDAHAWVEIYLDGYGWYPVEMTPGYAGGESGVELAGEPEVDSPEEPDEPEPEEPPEEETPDAPEDGEEPVGQEPEEEKPVFVIPWRALGRIALVLAALGGGYGLALLTRRRAKTDADVNRSVINAYRRYSRVLRLGGVSDDNLEALGRKAKFSQHILTEEERASAWQSLEEAVETAKKRQKPWKSWALELLRPIL